MLKQGINNQQREESKSNVVIQEALTAAAAASAYIVEFLFGLASSRLPNSPVVAYSPYEKLVTRGVWGVGRPAARWRSVSCFVFHLSTLPVLSPVLL